MHGSDIYSRMIRAAWVLCALWCCASTADASAPGAPSATGASSAASRRSLRHNNDLVGDNKELFTKLGLERLHIPAAHHRKRLAEESRHQGDIGDSKMYVIKLPPHPHYYAGEGGAGANAIAPAGRKLPVGFKSNGKPGRVYHWNVPLLRRVADKQARLDDPESTKTRLDKRHHSPKHSVTFYVPSKPKKSFHKYFSGNGKPKSFYVLHKNKNPIYYQRLLP